VILCLRLLRAGIAGVCPHTQLLLILVLVSVFSLEGAVLDEPSQMINMSPSRTEQESDPK
jgi:hypothetical protein